MAPATAADSRSEGLFHKWGSSHTLDQLDTCFDDTHAIANAGLLLPATLAQRLASSRPPMRSSTWASGRGAHRPGRKLLTLVRAMLVGGDCIDDTDLLRCGQTASVLGHRVMAPSTLGTFLRSSPSGMCASSTGWASRS
jgi:hypothetical protein